MSDKKIISLFTGAGGLDLGLEAAGFQTAVALEKDNAAVATLRHNLKSEVIDWSIIDQDIHLVPTDRLLKEGSLKRGGAALLVGGPPCQPFSKSGYWKNGDSLRLNDPRADTLAAYLRVLDEARPFGYVLENVEGLSYRGKSEGVELLRGVIEKLGYSFNMLTLNAADFGVPQIRKRVLIVGNQDGDEVAAPMPTHADPNAPEIFAPGETWMTAWDALHDIDEDDRDPTLQVSGRWAELLPTIPEGENYLWHAAHPTRDDRDWSGYSLFGWRRRYWSFLLKLSKSLPSWTITAQPGSAIGPFHWKNRRLSMRELARLQTFPDEYEVLGGRTAYQRQIGNAVPSALGEFVGRYLRAHLFGEAGEDKKPLSLLPPRAPRKPRPEPVIEKLPAAYRPLVAEYDPHPGTGRGPGAVSRRG
jgi:DNA (cytosine-5)-methyltransferase 1